MGPQIRAGIGEPHRYAGVLSTPSRAFLRSTSSPPLAPAIIERCRELPHLGIACWVYVLRTRGRPPFPRSGGRLRPDATGSIGALIGEVGFAADSLVEEAGFEPSVPGSRERGPPIVRGQVANRFPRGSAPGAG